MRSLSSCILVCWQRFGVIKWFSKLSDTYQEVRQSHKQEGAECASCLPAVLYRADSYKSLSLSLSHTHTRTQWMAEMFFRLESGSSRLSGKTKAIRADNKTACSCAWRQRINSQRWILWSWGNARFPWRLNIWLGAETHTCQTYTHRHLTDYSRISWTWAAYQTFASTIKAADRKSQKLARTKQIRQSLLVKGSMKGVCRVKKRKYLPVSSS